MASSGFEFLSETLPDALVLRTPRFQDHRGVFLKGYHSYFFSSPPHPFYPAEQFSSVSRMNVLRGMHFQSGKMAYPKLVSRPAGTAFDIILYVCHDSSNIYEPLSMQLSGKKPISVLIGKGYEHGFLSLSDKCTIQCLASAVHSPSNDKGVLWSGIAIDWPVDISLVSPRDSAHPPIGVETCMFL